MGEARRGRRGAVIRNGTEEGGWRGGGVTGRLFIYVPGERPAASRAGLFPRSPAAVGWMDDWTGPDRTERTRRASHVENKT
jgi:hypothetical protein